LGMELVERVLREGELKGDVLRVLSIFGGSLWLSEIEDEIKAMNYSMGVEVSGNVKEAVEELQKEGLVDLDYRTRGSLSGRDIKEYLVRLKQVEVVMAALANDRKYRDYLRLRYETMRG